MYKLYFQHPSLDFIGSNSLFHLLQYYKVRQLAVGSYDYKVISTDGTVPPVQLCYSYFKKGEINPNNNTYDFDPDTEQGIFLQFRTVFSFKCLIQSELNFSYVVVLKLLTVQ